MTLRHSPLNDEHVALGARLVEFGGWEMPLSYPSGTLAEHLACRHDAVVFDVSHLGTVRVEGHDAFARLQGTLTNDLTKVAPGRAQYTHLLDEDGFVLDDIIVWWVQPERFDVMPNASNTSGVLAAIGGEDVTSQRVVLAVQGPNARARLAEVSAEAAAVKRFGVTEFDHAGLRCVAAGTGYTGEDGVECAIPAEGAADFWRALISAGVTPAGLGARDTLRLEAGLPLHGHELGAGITPLQAGLGWVVGFDKEHFRGRDALLVERAVGPHRLLRGVLGAARRPFRAEDRIEAHGIDVGEVTSGNFSPVLSRGIALAFCSPDIVPGDAVTVRRDTTSFAAEIVKPPFQKLHLPD